MNKYNLLLSLILALCLSVSSYGQVEYLRLSPAQKIIQKVGMTDVTIEFSRPQMKGRTIFGELVPYGEMWRTGANENTKISFSHRVKIGETEVKEGTYALFTKPGLTHWEIYLYTETNHLDVPNPIDSNRLIFLMEVEVEQVEKTVETLVINVYDITETSANLGISWENTSVSIPITFYTQEAMEAMITKEFKQNVSDYTIAAIYYYQRGIELEKAKKLQMLAMELKEKPSEWDYYNMGIILYKLGDKTEAIKNINHSLELSKQSKNNYLINENTKLLTEWKE